MKLFNCWQADLLIRGLFKMDLITSSLRLTLSGTWIPARPAETRAEELEHILIDAWVHCMSFAFGCIIVCDFYCGTKPWASLTSIRLFIIHLWLLGLISSQQSCLFILGRSCSRGENQRHSSVFIFAVIFSQSTIPSSEAVHIITGLKNFPVDLYLYAKFSCLKSHDWTLLCGQVWGVLRCTSQQVLSHTVDGALSLSLKWSLLPSQSNTIWLCVQNV